MKRPLLVGICLLGSLLIVGLAMLLKPKDPACVRFQAKLELAETFCNGLADRAARERCEAISDSPEIMGQCMRVIVPAAHSSCMSYLNTDGMKREYDGLCR